MDVSEDNFVYDEGDIIDCASDAEANDMYPCVQMTANEFEELFGTLIPSLKDLSNHLYSLFAFYAVFRHWTIKTGFYVCFLCSFWPQDS